MSRIIFVTLIIIFALIQLQGQEFLIHSGSLYGLVEYDTSGRNIYADTFKINIDTRVRTGSPFSKQNMPAIAKKHRWAAYISRDAKLCLYNLENGDTTILANFVAGGRKGDEYIEYSFSPNDSFIVIPSFSDAAPAYYYSFADKKLYTLRFEDISYIITWTEKDTRVGMIGMNSDTLLYIEYDFVKRRKDTLFRISPVYYNYDQTIFSYNRIRRCLAYSTGKNVHLFDPATKKDTVIMTPNSYTAGEFGFFAWSPSGDKLAFNSQDIYFTNIHICDLKRGTTTHRFSSRGTGGKHSFLRWLNEDTLLYLRNPGGFFGFDYKNFTGVMEQNNRRTEKVQASVFPNPFNAETEVRYSIPDGGTVSLAVYDINGQALSTIENFYTSAGEYRYVWNTNSMNLASGVYFIRITFSTYAKTTSTLYLKTILLR